MKGVIFCYLKELISEKFGEKVWYKIVDLCPLKKKPVYIKPESYPDSDFLQIVEKASEENKESPTQFIQNLGKKLFPKMARDYPIFVSNFDHPKPFLLTVENIIHVEVKKLYPDAELPKFTYTDSGLDSLIIDYSSPKKLCSLMEGLIIGCSEFYGYDVEINHSPCIHDGSDYCRFSLVFKRGEPFEA